MQHTGNIMGFHLISSMCKLAQSDVDQFIILVSKHGFRMVPNLVSLQLEHFKIAGHLGSEDDLNLPMLEALELRFCIGVDSVNLVSPKLDNMSIADETSRDSAKLLSYLSMEEDRVNEALKLIQTVRLRKFKGSSTEMYLIRVLISHSKKFERMIIEQSDKGNVTSFKEQLRELLRCIYRASPKAVKLDLLWHMEVVPLWMTKVRVQYW
ncbi:hypothetical protein KY284_023259 [Solanum tuberosum]|nr:hypothetical protein KY284_023259 [Solanum tuberosum]